MAAEGGILWIARALPDSRHHGGYLRLVALARELSRSAPSYLALFSSGEDLARDLRGLGIFQDIVTFDGPSGRSRFSKHWRLSNAHFLKTAHPGYFESVTSRLSRLVLEENVHTGIAFTLNAAEILEALPCRLRVVDDYDCRTLTLERRIEDGRRGLYNRLVDYTHYWRIRNLESSLTSRFDLVTTISRADQERLRELANRRPQAIEVIKNGVDGRLLGYEHDARPGDHSVVFWGNLGFPPNRDAVQYFYDRIYVPHLEARGVRWTIVGADADDELERMTAPHEGIDLVGFVPDLAEFVTRSTVMVNPMVSGSGLKNKVLEAFALRIPVVSSAMGAEAIEATPGEHYLQEDSPEAFASSVLRCLDDPELRADLTEAAYRFTCDNYRWDAIGRQLEATLASAVAAKGRP